MNRNDLNIWFSDLMFHSKESPVLMNSQDLDDITVIIPSYNRQEFILRQFAYWSTSSATVIVLDGSLKPISEQCIEILSAFPRLNYLHAPISFIERLRLASQLISTDYTLMLGDDEFHLFTGLYTALSTLRKENKNNANIVGCMGQSLRFNFDVEMNSINIGEGYPHANFKVLGNKIEDRLNFAMKNYTPATSYGLLTSSCWQETWGAVESWSCPYAIELQQALKTYICGEFISVNEVYWMRSLELDPINTDDIDRNLSFRDWWTKKKYKNEKNRFIQLLAEYVVKKEGSSMEVALIKINKAVQIYILSSTPSNLRLFLSYLKSKILNFIPVKFNRGSNHDPHHFCSMQEYIVRINIKPASKNKIFISELTKLQELIREFYRRY